MRPPRRTFALLCLAALATAAGGVEPPLAARPAASAEASLTAATPIRVELAAGQSEVTLPADAAPGRPATFLFAAPVGVALTLGVSSKSGGAYLSIYEAGSERPLAGTEPTSGCVRWIGQSTHAGDLRIVVHTAGEATPVRLEVQLHRDLDFTGKLE